MIQFKAIINLPHVQLNEISGQAVFWNQTRVTTTTVLLTFINCLLRFGSFKVLSVVKPSFISYFCQERNYGHDIDRLNHLHIYPTSLSIREPSILLAVMM